VPEDDPCAVDVAFTLEPAKAGAAGALNKVALAPAAKAVGSREFEPPKRCEMDIRDETLVDEGLLDSRKVEPAEGVGSGAGDRSGTSCP